MLHVHEINEIDLIECLSRVVLCFNGSIEIVLEYFFQLFTKTFLTLVNYGFSQCFDLLDHDSIKSFRLLQFVYTQWQVLERVDIYCLAHMVYDKEDDITHRWELFTVDKPFDLWLIHLYYDNLFAIVNHNVINIWEIVFYKQYDMTTQWCIFCCIHCILSYQLVVQWSAAFKTVFRICSAASISFISKTNLASRFYIEFSRKHGKPDRYICLTTLMTCWWYLRAIRNPLITRFR